MAAAVAHSCDGQADTHHSHHSHHKDAGQEGGELDLVPTPRGELAKLAEGLCDPRSVKNPRLEQLRARQMSERAKRMRVYREGTHKEKELAAALLVQARIKGNRERRTIWGDRGLRVNVKYGALRPVATWHVMTLPPRAAS